MARLQRKKKSGAKKKKKPANETSTTLQGKQSTVSKKTAVSVVSNKRQKKQSASSQKRIVPATEPRKNYLNMATQFLREVVMELKKVTWPSRKQTTGSTIVMIILVVIVSIFLGMVDFGLSNLIRVVLQ